MRVAMGRAKGVLERHSCGTCLEVRQMRWWFLGTRTSAESHASLRGVPAAGFGVTGQPQHFSPSLLSALRRPCALGTGKLYAGAKRTAPHAHSHAGSWLPPSDSRHAPTPCSMLHSLHSPLHSLCPCPVVPWSSRWWRRCGRTGSSWTPCRSCWSRHRQRTSRCVLACVPRRD